VAGGAAGQCQAITWLGVDSAFCAINIIGAFYIATVISGDTVKEGSDQASMSAMERAKYVFCDDPKMAVFMLIRLGFIFWLFSGLGSLGSYEGCDDIGSPVETSVAFGFTYLSISFIFFSISMCCANRGRTNDPKSFALV